MSFATFHYYHGTFSISNSIPMYWLYILSVLKFPVLFHFLKIVWRDSASPWKIPLWIFASAKLISPAVHSTLQVFTVFSMKFLTSSDVIIIYSFRVFHISVSWWFFTGLLETASLLKSPGLVSRFWPFSAMLSFG